MSQVAYFYAYDTPSPICTHKIRVHRHRDCLASFSQLERVSIQCTFVTKH